MDSNHRPADYESRFGLSRGVRLSPLLYSVLESMTVRCPPKSAEIRPGCYTDCYTETGANGRLALTSVCLIRPRKTTQCRGRDLNRGLTVRPLRTPVQNGPTVRENRRFASASRTTLGHPANTDLTCSFLAAPRAPVSRCGRLGLEQLPIEHVDHQRFPHITRPAPALTVI